MVSASASTSSSDLVWFEKINEIKGATTGRPNRSISVKGQDLLFSDSMCEMILGIDNYTTEMVFADVQSKLRCLAEKL